MPLKKLYLKDNLDGLADDNDDDAIVGHKGAIEDSYNDNLEGLVDDEPNLYETSAVEGSPVLL